jgi:alpha-D-xyloside xylohydrolase
MTNPEAVSWWSNLLHQRLDEGADLFKTDFGEAIPIDVVAHDGTPGPYLHNLYALLYNDVVQKVTRDHGSSRPVVWARSTWAGGQRHPVQGSGDSNATWKDLAATLRSGLSMAMSGHSFWSHDIGGFHGTPSPELYVRWAQFGLLSAFSRFHGTSSRAPWDFGSEPLAAVRQAIELRMRLFPYLYATAVESAQNAVPIMRPMVLDYPQWPDAQSADLQYMLGPDLLVAPFYRPGGRRPVWFPPGRWSHYATGEVFIGPRWAEVALPLDQAPLYLRCGSVIPTLRHRLHIGDAPPTCEELVVVAGLLDGVQRWSASGRVVAEDDTIKEINATGRADAVAISAPRDLGGVTVLLLGRDRERSVAAEVNGHPVETRAGSFL